MNSDLLVAAMLLSPIGQDSTKATGERVGGPEWRSLEEATTEGRAFDDRAAPYDRLPADAEGVVRDPVWVLQRQSAGITARFVTNAAQVHARWSVTKKALTLPHMPATGASGLNLYGRDETGTWGASVIRCCSRPA